MSHLESIVDRLTELSGDRVSQIGDSMRTGLGWVGAYKLVLLADNEKCQFHGPASWRRASRIIGLARHLGKPLLLWNLSFHNDALRTRNLGTERAARDAQQHIIQFPSPIVSVIEGAQKNDLSPVELALPDGIVFVDGAETLWGHLTISPRTIIAGSPDGITSGISGLLAEIASIPADELVSQRRTRLASITLS